MVRAVTVATAMPSHTFDLQLPPLLRHLETWTSCPPARLHFLTVGILAGRFPPPQFN